MAQDPRITRAITDINAANEALKSKNPPPPNTPGMSDADAAELLTAETTLEATLGLKNPPPVGTPGDPVISSVSPQSGPSGANVSLFGSNFGATMGISTVSIDGAVVPPPTSWSDTSITLPVGGSPRKAMITVTVNGVTSAAIPYTITP